VIAHICPSCEVFPSFSRWESNPDLGTITQECFQARCDLMPYCVEVKVDLAAWASLLMRQKSLIIDRITVELEDEDFLTSLRRV